MSYVQIFGGTTIYPSDVSLLAVSLTADIVLDWPLESAAAEYPAARIIDVTASGNFVISLPDATLTGAGQTLLFNNLSTSASSFTVEDFAGNVLATITVGEQWQLYLASTATAAGTWRVFRFGASTATVQPSALAGYGITTTSNTLSQSMPVTTVTVSPRAVLLTDRATVMVWTGSGSGTFALPSAAAAGNNFFVSVRNSGGGVVTVDPDGSEEVDGAAELLLQPGDSATLTTDGLGWYSVGLGQQAVFAFDFTSVAVTGGTYTLAGSELNRIAYRFTGTLTSDCVVIVPPTVQQYWIDNATSGAYTLTLKTASGTGSVVTQGGRGIYYCDGANLVDADTSTVALPVSAPNGGTGLTSYTAGDILYAASTTALARLADVAVGNALISGGVGVVPAWGKIGLTTHVSGTLPIASGGTGATDAAGARANLGVGSVTSVGGTGTVNGITLTGTVTTSGNLTLGGTLSGVSLTTQVTGTLPVANGGTGATDAAGARTALGAGTVTSVAGAGTVNGLTLTGTVTASGSLTLGGSVTSVAAAATVNGFVIGYRSVPRSTTSGTAVAGDNAKCIAVSAGLTVPAATFAAGDAFSIYNDSASPVTLTQGGGLTLRWAGTTSTGNRTLAARGLATVWFNSASEAIISGAGVS